MRVRSASHGTFGRPPFAQIAVAHERIAAQILGQQRDAASDARHRLLADFLEAVGAVEQHRDVVARLEEHLAGQHRHAHFGEARDVRIEHAAEAETAERTRDDDAVDVDEFGIALAEPAIVRTVVRRAIAQRQQESGDLAIGFGDAQIARVAGQAGDACAIEREDRRSGRVVECENCIQLVRLHVADG